MDEPLEELAPLFDYSRVQPVNLVYSDDDNLDSSPVCIRMKKKKKPKHGNGKENCEVVEIDDIRDKGGKTVEENEEDWLPSPPRKTANLVLSAEEEKTLHELRLKKQELASLAGSAESIMKAVIEAAKQEVSSSGKSSVGSDGPKSKPQDNREKLIISIQDKDGTKQYRIYKDDKFEKIFKMYAERVKLCSEKLVFSFDGDKVNPSATPGSLGMEDDDMIEVHVKPS